MPNSLPQQLELLATAGAKPGPRDIVRGIEKESLRVTPQGRLAQTPHPPDLGSALCNPYITTDYSEALLEFITPPDTDIDSTLGFLDDIHRFTYPCLQQEMLWCASMPCVLRGNEDIPVARYGSSNTGQMKTVYRLGLGLRYGRAMQVISGIHYNFSLSDPFWGAYAKVRDTSLPLQQFKDQEYLGLIRNFRRHVWLLIYLFGASPALCKSFLGQQPHELDYLDPTTLYRPGATALRMGKLGYQSSTQEDIVASYNSLDEYIASLRSLLTREQTTYRDLGTHDAEGRWQQLSTSLLQIENEFYSAIRPKQPTRSGEAPIRALAERGIQYIEVRALDVNPYLPLGIDADQIRLLDIFLLYCLLQNSPPLSDREYLQSQDNLALVVDHGRDRTLKLDRNGHLIAMHSWAAEILDSLLGIARWLDEGSGDHPYELAVKAQQAKLADPGQTPAGRILQDMSLAEINWFQFAMEQSLHHARHFGQRPLEPSRSAFFRDAAAQSIAAQAEIERASTQDFSVFLEDYYRQYRAAGD